VVPGLLQCTPTKSYSTKYCTILLLLLKSRLVLVDIRAVQKYNSSSMYN
jgi:hypothetical protein